MPAKRRRRSHLLYRVAPWDPVVFVCVPLALSGVAMVAIWIPARQAVRVHVVRVLRGECGEDG